jgi:hypothetical protein
MRVEPFDSPDCRAEILRTLNDLHGVEIEETEIYRWPRLPIEILAREENLLKFVTIVDRLACEAGSGFTLGNDLAPSV